jgi:hypothetical protein
MPRQVGRADPALPGAQQPVAGAEFEQQAAVAFDPPAAPGVTVVAVLRRDEGLVGAVVQGVEGERRRRLLTVSAVVGKLAWAA